MNLGQIFKEGRIEKGKHTDIIMDLVSRMKRADIYDEIMIYANYSQKGIAGDADILAVYKNYILNFEIKSSNRNSWDAKKQLNKTKKIINELFPNYRVFNFFVHGFAENPPTDYKIKWIKKSF